jgi:transcriptional regulator with XRE-family HTH domain
VSEPLGLALQRIREARVLTIEELAQKSGVAALTIRDTERGESTPRMDTIAKLAKPLGLTFEEVWSLQRRRE